MGRSTSAERHRRHESRQRKLLAEWEQVQGLVGRLEGKFGLPVERILAMTSLELTDLLCDIHMLSWCRPRCPWSERRALLLEAWPPCSAAEVARDDEDKEPVGHVLTAAERQRRRRRRIAVAARDLPWRWSQLGHLEELFNRSAGAVLRTKPFELWQVVQAQARAEHVGNVVWGWRHPLWISVRTGSSGPLSKRWWWRGLVPSFVPEAARFPRDIVPILERAQQREWARLIESNVGGRRRIGPRRRRTRHPA